MTHTALPSTKMYFAEVISSILIVHETMEHTVEEEEFSTMNDMTFWMIPFSSFFAFLVGMLAS